MKFQKNTKSFILLEMLVSIAIFVIVLVSLVSISASSIRNQKIVLSNQELFNQTSYVLEYVSRALRMVQKDSTGGCVGAVNRSYANPYGNSSIRFLNYNGKCQEFYVEAGELKEKKSPNNTSASLPFSGTSFTSSHLIISSVFLISGDVGGDSLQPRVTVNMDIISGVITNAAKFKVQTTISQRNLDL